MSSTQENEAKELRDAWEYFWTCLEGDAFKWDALTDEANNEYRNALKEKVKLAFEATVFVFWKKQEEPVDAPKVGEWWYVKVGATNAVPVKLVAVNTMGSYLFKGSNSFGDIVHCIIDANEIMGRVPPMFPRLHRLVAKIRAFWNTPLSY